MKKTNEREIALDILTEILRDGAYGNISLRRALGVQDHLRPVQKAFVTEVVNGSLRNLILIDYIIDHVSSVATRKMKPFILNLLRISVYQLMFMDKTPPSAVCNEAVKLVKARGYQNLAGFMNGVLRNIERKKNVLTYPGKDKEPDRYLSVMYSWPLWLVKYWLQRYGYEDTERICMFGNRPPRVGICVNLLKTNVHALKERLLAEGVQVTDRPDVPDALLLSGTGDLAGLPAFRDGAFHVMDEGAMRTVKMLDPRPGETVMDVCAAPGGKAFYAAYMMENTGEIRAWDIHPHKIKLVEESAARLGIGTIICEVADARVPKPGLQKTVDKVLVDAPCTGFGIARKKPDIKYARDRTVIETLAAQQKELLTACSAYVKPGGVLVYCTCTITREENDEIAAWFATHFPFAPDGTEQMLPGENNDGFYIARFIRKE